MSDDKATRRAYWSSVLAVREKQLAKLLARQMSLVDDSGHDLTPSVIATHEKAIAEAKRELAVLDGVGPIWTDLRDS